MEDITEHDIYRWCNDHGVNIPCSLGIVGNFVGITDAEVLTEVQKLWGVKVPILVDKWKRETGETRAVLITTKEYLDSSLIPANVMVGGEMSRRWQIMWPRNIIDSDRGGSEPTRLGERVVLPEEHSLQRGDDTQSPMLKDLSKDTTGENIEPQVETVLDKVVSHFERWHYEGGYRRLRVFSGILPVPTGEEGYDAWREAAIQHSEEWRCPEHIKKQRIVESLRGPAMGIIHATRRSNPNATLKDYFNALDYSFGTLEDLGDILVRLNQTYQEPTESLTNFIYRIAKILYKLLDKGGIQSSEIDERHLKQLLRGALTTHPVAQRLRCSGPGARPPTLSEMIKDVKLEEGQIENRERSLKRVKVVLPAPVEPPSNVLSPNEKLYKLLEEQNKKLDQIITLQRNVSLQDSRGRGRGPNRRMENRDQVICYRCGQMGHRSFECPQVGNYGMSTDNHDRRNTTPSENQGGTSMNPASTPGQ
ncbi:paraneoplastic antigen Ma1 homolog [Pseudophryne corroboree]|uniref:paraneoplastic antigen Ma1 homolog n=1 Tax=Pseudophryne corroboree TaxID=495146 RepID=UPI003081B10E